MTNAVQFFILLVFVSFATCGIHVNAQIDTTNPQFVFVHGIGHGAWCFSWVISYLQDAGFTATAIDLTSAGINKTSAEDVQTVDEYLDPLYQLFETSIDQPTIIVGHSLGGGPISVIVEKYPEKIAAVVYLAAAYPVNGNTFFNAFPGSVFMRLFGENNLISIGDPATSVALKVSNLTAFFYNRSPRLAVNLASTDLTPTPTGPGQEPITLTGERFGRSRKFYIKTLSDLGVLPSEQQEMINASPWKPEKIFLLPNADHAAFFSQPRHLARILGVISSRVR